MKINDIIMERLPTNNAGEVVGKGGKYKSKHPFIGDKVAVFHGPNSKSWDPEMVELARKLEKRKLSRDAIWKRTGTFRTVDGKWRQEIPDNTMKINDLQIGKDYKLKDVIDHDRLFKAYPNFKNLNIEVREKKPNGPMGQYEWGNSRGDQPKIVLFLDPDYPPDYTKHTLKNTIAHEIQHAIQHIEDPSSGQFSNSYADDATDMYMKQKQAGLNVTQYDSYKDYWQEIDAWLVGDRAYWNDKDLKQNVPTPDRDLTGGGTSDYVTIQNNPNRVPGKPLAKHDDLIGTDKITIKNIFKKTPNATPQKDDPLFKHGNPRGSVDKSDIVAPHGDWRSPMRNKNNTPTSSVKPKPRPANLGSEK